MSTDEFTIRLATGADAAALAELGARTFRETYEDENDPSDLESYLEQSFSVERISEELSDPAATFLVAELYGTPIGYAMLLAGDVPPSVTGPSPVELVRIYMDRGSIGHGYGSGLMRACLEEAGRRGFSTVWLGVWERNDSGQSFYRKWGFRPVGTKEFEVGGDVQTDLIMVRAVEG